MILILKKRTYHKFSKTRIKRDSEKIKENDKNKKNTFGGKLGVRG